MKILLVAESRDGKLLGSTNELIAFAAKMGGDSVMFLVGSESQLPAYDGKLYLAEAAACGEYNPDAHKRLLLEVIAKEQPDMIAFSHSSYGWDLAPRVAFALKAAQVSELVDVVDGELVVPVCNAKLRRNVRLKTKQDGGDPAGRGLRSDRTADRHSDRREDRRGRCRQSGILRL